MLTEAKLTMAKRSFVFVAWDLKIGSLFSTLRRRAGKLPFNLAEFRQWADETFTREPWCAYCRGVFTGNENVSVDHKMPLNASHDSSFANLALCCKRCNQAKGGVMDDRQFRALVAALDICGPAARSDVLGRLARSTSVFIARNRKGRK